MENSFFVLMLFFLFAVCFGRADIRRTLPRRSDFEWLCYCRHRIAGPHGVRCRFGLQPFVRSQYPDEGRWHVSRTCSGSVKRRSIDRHKGEESAVEFKVRDMIRIQTLSRWILEKKNQDVITQLQDEEEKVRSKTMRRKLDAPVPSPELEIPRGSAGQLMATLASGVSESRLGGVLRGRSHRHAAEALLIDSRHWERPQLDPMRLLLCLLQAERAVLYPEGLELVPERHLPPPSLPAGVVTRSPMAMRRGESVLPLLLLVRSQLQHDGRLCARDVHGQSDLARWEVRVPGHQERDVRLWPLQPGALPRGSWSTGIGERGAVFLFAIGITLWSFLFVLPGRSKERQQREQQAHLRRGQGPPQPPKPELHVIHRRKGESSRYFLLCSGQVNLGRRGGPQNPRRDMEVGSDGSSVTIIDSGTTLSYFAEPAYEIIWEAVLGQIKRYPLIKDIEILNPCYNIFGVENVEPPEFTIHFADGAVWDFPDENYFIMLIPNELVCLAILGTPCSALSIIGNYQQQNFHIPYDTKRSRLGYAPMRYADV